jgi:hypothetical protein
VLGVGVDVVGAVVHPNARAHREGAQREVVAGLDAGAELVSRGLALDETKKDVTRFEPGFSSDAGGVIVGADYRVLPWLTAGLVLSYLGTNGNFTSNTGHFSTDAFGVTLCGSVTPLPNLFVNDTVGYTLRAYDTVRRASYFNPTTIGVDAPASSTCGRSPAPA